GSVIPAAKLKVTNEGTNIATETLTDSLGNYEVTSLNPGIYTVSVQASGFQTYTHQQINLDSGQILRIDVPMQVGSISDSVTVTAQAPLVNTETGAISAVRSGRELAEGPLNYLRNDAFNGGIYRLVQLIPGSYRDEGTGANAIAGALTFQINWVA